MFEVEIKAHVNDKNSVAQKVSSFAKFEKIITKHDEYFKLERAGKEHITARIRTEEEREPCADLTDFSGRVLGKKCFLTYKQKSKHTKDCVTLEVNDERETEIGDAACVKSLLLDSGFEPYITKRKNSVMWTTPLDEDDALSSAEKTVHIELCAVFPLGDFLEIEIMSSDNNAKTILSANEKLKSLVLRSGLSLADIEPKYYSELLNEIARPEC